MPRWLPRTLEIAGWAVLAPLLGLCITQWFGIEGRRTITAFQALTPYALLCAVPVSLAASVTRRHALALVALVPVVTLLVLAFPVVFHTTAAEAQAGAPRLTVAFANCYFENPTPATTAAAMAATDADVLVMVEYTPQLHDALVAVLHDDYPYRLERARLDGGGVAVWSRFPVLTGGITRVSDRPTVDVTIDVHGRTVRVLGVHTFPPTHNAKDWQQQLRDIGTTAGDSSLPTVIVGDFNASWWHPSFRALLHQGWRDTHQTLGQGWGASWPANRGWLPPPFVRIDHALFRSPVTPIAIRDLHVPGSDHVGLVATFAVNSTG